MKIHLGWITSLKWASTAKKIFRSYQRICSRVLKSLAIEFSSSSHLVSDKGGIDDSLQASKIHQVSPSHSLNLLPKPTSRDIHAQIQSCSQRQSNAPEHAFDWWPSLNYRRLKPPFSGCGSPLFCRLKPPFLG